MYKLGKRSRKNMIGMYPPLAYCVEIAIQRTKQDFCILNSGGVRTLKQQKDLYAKGRTKKGKKVTWTMNSLHLKGTAVDLVAYVDGKPTWDDKYYTEIINVMKEVSDEFNLGVDSGYDLWGKDKAHYQCTNTDYDIRDY